MCVCARARMCQWRVIYYRNNCTSLGQSSAILFALKRDLVISRVTPTPAVEQLPNRETPVRAFVRKLFAHYFCALDGVTSFHVHTIKFRLGLPGRGHNPPSCANGDMHGRKAKSYNTCIVPQAAYRSCSGAVHVTDRADVQPIGRRLRLQPMHKLTYDQPTIRSPGLSFSGLHPRNPCNYMDYYLFTDHNGMEG